MIIRHQKLFGAATDCLRYPPRRLIRARAQCRFFQSGRSVMNVHSLPRLTNIEMLEKEGIPGLFSSGAFQMAWTENMSMALQKLNMILPDTDKNMRTKDLLIKYARDPENASIFNYASMLYNTHFFFDGLNSTGTPIPPSESLAREIMNSFSTPAALRTDFLTTAHSMFGPGFIWLVRVIESDQKQTAPVFKILPTYLAGSPYAGAHYRQQSSDQNTQARDAANRGLSAFDFQRQHIVQNNVGFLGPMSRGERRVSKGGVEVNPVLCVSTWEHMWLRQFGISGKGRYLNAFWDKINWRVVENRMKANDYS